MMTWNQTKPPPKKIKPFPINRAATQTYASKTNQTSTTNQHKVVYAI